MMAYVSDHAVLRYLERHYGVDVEAIRAEMESPVIGKAAAFGCNTVKMPNGVRLKLQGDVVATALESPKRRRRR